MQFLESGMSGRRLTGDPRRKPGSRLRKPSWHGPRFSPGITELSNRDKRQAGSGGREFEGSAYGFSFPSIGIALSSGCMTPSFSRTYSSEIGRAHVCTPVTNANLVCRLLLANKQQPILV